MVKKLLIATTNPAKTKEYKEMLADLSLETVSLNDLNDFKAVEENGRTIKENAILKAKGYFSQFHLPVIADDGSLEIDALDGAPGVESRRWLGYKASDEELAKYALKKLANVPQEQRKARIAVCAAFYDGSNLLLGKGAVEGYITERMSSSMEKGFPWRSILFIPRFNKLYQDLTFQENQEINHRRKILEKLKPEIKKALKI